MQLKGTGKHLMVKASLLDLPLMVQRPASESTKGLSQVQETLGMGSLMRTQMPLLQYSERLAGGVRTEEREEEELVELRIGKGNATLNTAWKRRWKSQYFNIMLWQLVFLFREQIRFVWKKNMDLSNI